MTNLKREQLIELLGKIIKQSFLSSKEYHIFCEAIHIAEPVDYSERYKLTIDAIEWLKKDFIKEDEADKALTEKINNLFGFNNAKDNPN